MDEDGLLERRNKPSRESSGYNQRTPLAACKGMAESHEDVFDSAMVGEFAMMFEDDEEAVTERETDRLVQAHPDVDEWILSGAGEEPARRRVGWEVGLAVACGTHQRLGACSPLSQLSDSDMLMEVLKWVPIVVPDHCGTLKQAVDMALPGQEIFIRKGEHNVGEMPGQEAATASGRGVGHTVLDIHKSVHLIGERGTLLRGMLVLRESAGCASVRHMTVQDAGQCSLLCESGSWDVSDANIICGHACAVKAVGRAAVRLRRCRIGGEGEIGQAVALEYEVPRTWVDTAGSVREYACDTCRCVCMLACWCVRACVDTPTLTPYLFIYYVCMYV